MKNNINENVARNYKILVVFQAKLILRHVAACEVKDCKTCNEYIDDMQMDATNYCRYIGIETE